MESDAPRSQPVSFSINGRVIRSYLEEEASCPFTISGPMFGTLAYLWSSASALTIYFRRNIVYIAEATQGLLQEVQGAETRSVLVLRAFSVR